MCQKKLTRNLVVGVNMSENQTSSFCNFPHISKPHKSIDALTNSAIGDESEEYPGGKKHCVKIIKQSEQRHGENIQGIFLIEIHFPLSEILESGEK